MAAQTTVTANKSASGALIPRPGSIEGVGLLVVVVFVDDDHDVLVLLFAVTVGVVVSVHDSGMDMVSWGLPKLLLLLLYSLVVDSMLEEARSDQEDTGSVDCCCCEEGLLWL